MKTTYLFSILILSFPAVLMASEEDPNAHKAQHRIKEQPSSYSPDQLKEQLKKQSEKIQASTEKLVKATAELQLYLPQDKNENPNQ